MVRLLCQRCQTGTRTTTTRPPACKDFGTRQEPLSTHDWPGGGRSIDGFNSPTAAVCFCTAATPASATCSSRGRRRGMSERIPLRKARRRRDSHPVRQKDLFAHARLAVLPPVGFGAIKKRCRTSGVRRAFHVSLRSWLTLAGAASLSPRRSRPRQNRFEGGSQAEVSTPCCPHGVSSTSSSKPSWSMRTAETILWTAELLAPSTRGIADRSGLELDRRSKPLSQPIDAQDGRWLSDGLIPTPRVPTVHCAPLSCALRPFERTGCLEPRDARRGWTRVAATSNSSRVPASSSRLRMPAPPPEFH